MWETALLFHKNSGKPGGKSEKILQWSQKNTLYSCAFEAEKPHECCVFLSFPQIDGLFVEFLEWTGQS